MSKKAVLYARSATGEGNSLDGQMAACRAWAEQRGYTVVSEYREVVSGNALHPPLWAMAVKQAQSQQAVVVCVEPSRISRNIVFYIQRLADCERWGVAVHFVNRPGAQEGDTPTESSIGDWIHDPRNWRKRR